MAIILRNQETNEVFEVNNSAVHADGTLWVWNKNKREFGKGWHNTNYMLQETGVVDETGYPNINVQVELIGGTSWVVDSTKPQRTRKPRSPKDKTPDREEPQPIVENNEVDAEIVEIETPTKSEPQPMPTPKAFKVDGLEGGLAQAFAPVFANVAAQIEANIRAKVDGEIRELKEIAEKKAKRLEIKIHEKINVVRGRKHKVFESVLNRVVRGRNIYLWGPAGTGKSYLAKQISDALGLPFYSETTLQDPFDLKGFKDASGRYQETQFYKAVKGGGVFNLDEGDATAADVFVVVNTLLANGYFSFPNGERLDVHPDFHFICTANTCGLGATQEYNGRFKMDESTRDRFSFIYVAPDPEIEMEMAGNDAEIIEFAYGVRKAIKKANGLEFNCSARVIKALALSSEYNESPEDTLDAEFIKGRSIDNVKTLVYNMDVPSTNKWMKALSNIANNKEKWER